MNSVDLTLVPSKKQNASSWRDMIGIIASVGCAIHCAAMPFVFAYLPAMGLSFLADEAFHKWMALICFLIAIAAFLPGLRRHRSWWPIGIGSVGLSLITYAAFGLAGECCSACEAKVQNVDSRGEAVASCDECEDCEHCATTTSTTGTTNVASREIVIESDPSNEQKNVLALLAPWITPLGGMVLVSAHLLNHRFGCSCSCCHENVSETEES